MMDSEEQKLERERAIRRAVSLAGSDARDSAYREKIAAQKSRIDMQATALDKADVAAMASLAGRTITDYLLGLHRANLRDFMAKATPREAMEFDTLADHFYGKYSGDRTLVHWQLENLP